MNEEKQKDGGILRSEEEKTGHTGYYDFNKLQEQKQTLTRAKKVLRATPEVLWFSADNSMQAGGTVLGRKGRVHSRHEGAPKRGPESPVGPKRS